MKSGIIAALAGLAAAQNLSGEPACATACLSSAISAAGCAPADQACQCGPTQADIGLKAAPCLIKSCAASDLIKAQSVGAALCLAYSVDAGLTTVTSSPTTSSTPGSTSGTAPFVVSSTSGTPSSTATSTVVESSGTGGGVTGTKETFTTTPAPTTTGTGSGSAGAGAGSSSSGGAGSSSSKTNLAAAASPVMIGGAIAAFMGAVAAL